MFRFPLQKILDVRREREKHAAGRLARAREAEDEAREARHALERIRAAGSETLAAAHGNRPTAGELQNVNLILEAIDARIDAATARLADAEAEVRRRLEAFTSAYRDRRVLDRLRERRLENWREESARADRSEMDAVAVTRFSRSKRAGGEKDR